LLDDEEGSEIRVPGRFVLSGFDVLVEPQNILWVILLLDLCQAGVVGSVSLADKLLACFT
jgi:hypothetical protein